MTGLALGGLRARCTTRPARPSASGRGDVPLGLASAGVLYVTFPVGDRFARRFVPGGEREIARDLRPARRCARASEIAARLAPIIGPAEELFWRGLVQTALMRRYGPLAGRGAGGGGLRRRPRRDRQLHPARRGRRWPAPTGARSYAAGVPLGALVVSHVTWDIWIFLLQPTNVVVEAA